MVKIELILYFFALHLKLLDWEYLLLHRNAIIINYF